MILPDVPFEEKEEFDIVCKEYGLDFISTIAPTSHQRIQIIAKKANGFIYCVSSLGVTGVRSEITTNIGAIVDLVREVTNIPCSGRIWNFYTRTSKKDGISIRWCHRW